MAARKAGVGSGLIRVTERDEDIVWWLGRVRLATVKEVQQRFGMARSKAYGRLQGLVELGLVRHERGVPGSGVYLATRQGFAMVELELAPATVSLVSLRHDLALAGVVAGIETSRLGSELLTERELRAYRERTGDERFRPQLHHRPGGATSRHWPDLALVHKEGWLGVGVELTQTSAGRTRDILAGYAATAYSRSSDLWGVLYLTLDGRCADRLSQVARRERLNPDSPVTFRAQPLEAPGGIESAIRGMAETVRVVRQRQAQEQAARDERQRRAEAEQAAHAAVSDLERRRTLEAAAADEAEAARPRRFGVCSGVDEARSAPATTRKGHCVPACPDARVHA